MDIISLFAGCGGLDLGFSKAGFNVIWANEFNKAIAPTYSFNHIKTILDTRSISNIPSNDIPESIGIIGGPPCQSWSTAGSGKGIDDPRGKLFYEFIRVINDKNPLFFLAENVEGMLNKKHEESLSNIKQALEGAGLGYELSVVLLNAADYNVPQNRKRVFFVGYRKDLNIKFVAPKSVKPQPNVFSVLNDLADSVLPALPNNRSNTESCAIANHEYWQGGFSYIFMSRNRVLNWNKPSYTIQASGRQVSLHPQAPEMIKAGKDVRVFDKEKIGLYRRLSVRECARIQTFPDTFILKYQNLDLGYKMLGNAVPVNLAHAIGKQIFRDLSLHFKSKKSNSCHIDLPQRQLVLS